MTCDVLFSLALCANRSFSSSTCRFAAQAQCFGRLRVLVAVPVGFAIQGWSLGGLLLGRRVIVFAPAPFSLALSYNRLVLAKLKHVNIGQNHSGLQSRASFGCVSYTCQIWISWQVQQFG